MLISERVVVEG